MQGDVAAALLQDHRETAKRLATEWARLFPGRFYLELQRAGAPQTESYLEAAVRHAAARDRTARRSEEHTSELQSLRHLVCRLLLEKKKTINTERPP